MRCVLALLWFLQISSCLSPERNSQEDLNNSITSHRQAKWGWFPFYPIGLVRIENSECNASNNLVGICYTRRQCVRAQGLASGFCVRKIAVCCILQRTCGDTSNANNTYFQNPGYPMSLMGGTRCVMTIERCNSDVGQLRLDFLTLVLAQPDSDGVCRDDVMTITGAASIIPSICGDNSGQHMYMDFNGDQTIQIIIETTSALTFARLWNIQAIQLTYDHPNRAPSGCLMYYTELSGTVKSFNYGPNKNAANLNMGTREIANLNYGVCIAMQPGFCSIEWSQTSGDRYSFTVSGNTDDLGEDVGTPEAEVSGVECNSDFVVIPNPVENGVQLDTDRFCGNGFATKRTSSKPFVLTVVTDANEEEDIGNRGFSLDFSQKRCTGRF